MKRALITGITGQDGSYLAELLLEKDYEVFGLVRRTSLPNTARIAHILDRVTLIPGDLLDSASIARAISLAQPHEVYNLAAQSHVGESFRQPLATAEINAIGVARLLEVLRCHKKDMRFYQASTSELFGQAEALECECRNEDSAFRPRSPYAIAKLYAHHLVRNYRESYGLFACSGILFNHESPRRGYDFVTRKITRAVARIRCGLQDALHLGNMEAMRDWGFAGDYVEAMWRMVQQDSPQDYVIATEESHSVREFAELAFAHVGLSWKEYVICDKMEFRPSDVAHLRGDASRAHCNLGWQPSVSFEQLVHLMVDADMRELANFA